MRQSRFPVRTPSLLCSRPLPHPRAARALAQDFASTIQILLLRSKKFYRRASAKGPEIGSSQSAAQSGKTGAARKEQFSQGGAQAKGGDGGGRGGKAGAGTAACRPAHPGPPPPAAFDLAATRRRRGDFCRLC